MGTKGVSETLLPVQQTASHHILRYGNLEICVYRFQHRIYLDLLWPGSKHSGFLKSVELLNHCNGAELRKKDKAS